ncbi:juvenile hormone acid O-methyltransferase-like [Bradysia coprophila]|uniref:juvenile hormone acid O-methyltransferase-like n=1 Tax=Bradysia coprophila TaxID=38358 RepID=UPI00187D8A7A|nr:juvenile hormone acid O-methyltransferase-like [Bradysia coprophila]
MLKKIGSKMFKPELWESNKPNTPLVRALMEEYKDKFNWRADGRDSLMDVGCAGGGHTMEFVLPILPKNFDRLIGIDNSSEMIAYAHKTYSRPNIEFKTFDIVEGDTKKLPQVDHIVSLYVFHLLSDHEKAVTNMFDVLKPGGDCFLAHLRYFGLYTAYELISRDPKWSKYITDVNDVIIPSYFSKCPESDLEQLLKKCGFKSVEVSSREASFEVGDFNVLKDLIKTVASLYKGIPLAQHDDFTNDLTHHAIDAFNSFSYNKHSTTSKVFFPGATLVAYSKK